MVELSIFDNITLSNVFLGQSILYCGLFLQVGLLKQPPALFPFHSPYLFIKTSSSNKNQITITEFSFQSLLLSMNFTGTLDNFE